MADNIVKDSIFQWLIKEKIPPQSMKSVDVQYDSAVSSFPVPRGNEYNLSVRAKQLTNRETDKENTKRTDNQTNKKIDRMNSLFYRSHLTIKT